MSDVRPGPCPACGSRELPIVYGLPGAALSAAARRGEIRLGGCLPPDRQLGVPTCPLCRSVLGPERAPWMHALLRRLPVEPTNSRCEPETSGQARHDG